MLFSHGSGQQRIDDNKKCRRIAGDFDGHGDRAHPGFTRSHWTPPSGECLRRIAPSAAMVEDFE